MSQQVINDSILKEVSVGDLSEVNALSKYTITESEARMQTLKSLLFEYFGSNWIQFLMLGIILILVFVLLISVL